MARERGTSKRSSKTERRVKTRSAGDTKRKQKAAGGKKRAVKRPKTAKKAARKTTAKRRKQAAGVRRESTGPGRVRGAGSGTARRGASGGRKTAVSRKKMSKAAKIRMEKLRTMLEQRRVEILAAIRKAREETVEAHGRTFPEVGDLVSASLEKEMAFKFGEYGVNMLREIDMALEKLKEGSYGICEACGRIIGVKRLEVVPSARLCIKCKAREEAKGGL